ncbi:unnamed protein product [Dovyalis caffra]|uniref:Uncharacterized protein n=1 Tax=Dovyalis caffra TaxID=77055 RepID=A0AAV1RIB8_9ROSI|nr:unnamed protein product [Dovyalis caffra]
MSKTSQTPRCLISYSRSKTWGQSSWNCNLRTGSCRVLVGMVSKINLLRHAKRSASKAAILINFVKMYVSTFGVDEAQMMVKCWDEPMPSVFAQKVQEHPNHANCIKFAAEQAG